MTQIFAPPVDPLQYRAVGLLKGIYKPSGEDLIKGKFHTSDGMEMNAYVNPNIVHLVRNTPAVTQEPIIWTVYPRTIKAPPFIAVELRHARRPRNEEEADALKRAVDKFSVRGQIVDVVQHDASRPGFLSFTVEICRNAADSQRQDKGRRRDRPMYLTVHGRLPEAKLGEFWDFKLNRRQNRFLIDSGTVIATLAIPKPRPKITPKKPKVDSRRQVDRQQGTESSRAPVAPPKRKAALAI